MKKIVIALTALAGIVFMSGCAYDYYPYYYYDPHYGHYVQMVYRS
jgi:heme/copper-type cytochrome/quinol oxidase subunit 3